MSDEKDRKNKFAEALDGPVKTPGSLVESGYEPSFADKRRADAQGAFLGLSDEIEAMLRSVGPEKYEEALAEIRQSLAKYQQNKPMEYLGREMVGAGAMGAALAPFTGGTSIPMTLGRVAAVNAANAGLTAFNQGEGGIGNRIAGVPTAAVTGAIAGPIGNKVFKTGGEILKALGREARFLAGQKGSSAVNNEIQRLANKLQLTPEEVAEGIAEGRILAENETLLAAVKALRAKGGKAGDVINNALKKRPQDTRLRAAAAMSEGLGGDGQLEIAKRTATKEAQRLKEKQLYLPFKEGTVGDEVFGEIIQALEAVPSVRPMLMKKFQARVNDPDYTPLFRMEGDELRFLRRPTPEEAEQIRRGLDKATSNEYAPGGAGGFVAGDYDEIAKNVRAAINKEFPDLANARAMAKAARDQGDAFKAGQDVFAGKADEKIMELQNLITAAAESGNEDMLNAYRSGMLATIQGRLLGNSRASFIKRLQNPEDGYNQLLRMAVPEEKVDNILRKLEIAEESNRANNVVLNRTITGEVNIEAQAGKLGLNPQTIMEAMGGNPRSIAAVASGFGDMFARDLSDKERERVAQLLVSEDPDLVLAALTDTKALQRVKAIFAGATDAVTSGAERGVTVGVGAEAGRQTRNNVEQNAQGVLKFLFDRQ